MENKNVKPQAQTGGHDVIKVVFEARKPQIRRMIVGYGLTPATSDLDLWKKLNYLIKQFPNEVLKQLSLLHPDRKFILGFMDESESTNHSKGSISEPLPQMNSQAIEDKIRQANAPMSNACGCSGADGSTEYSNCGGNSECSCNKGANKNSSADGTSDKPSAVAPVATVATTENNKKVSDTVKEYMPLIIAGSLLLFGFYAINKYHAPSHSVKLA